MTSKPKTIEDFYDQSEFKQSEFALLMHHIKRIVEKAFPFGSFSITEFKWPIIHMYTDFARIWPLTKIVELMARPLKHYKFNANMTNINSRSLLYEAVIQNAGIVVLLLLELGAKCMKNENVYAKMLDSYINDKTDLNCLILEKIMDQSLPSIFIFDIIGTGNSQLLKNFMETKSYDPNSIRIVSTNQYKYPICPLMYSTNCKKQFDMLAADPKTNVNFLSLPSNNDHVRQHIVSEIPFTILRLIICQASLLGQNRRADRLTSFCSNPDVDYTGGYNYFKEKKIDLSLYTSPIQLLLQRCDSSSLDVMTSKCVKYYINVKRVRGMMCVSTLVSMKNLQPYDVKDDSYITIMQKNYDQCITAISITNIMRPVVELIYDYCQ